MVDNLKGSVLSQVMMPEEHAYLENNSMLGDGRRGNSKRILLHSLMDSQRSGFSNIVVQDVYTAQQQYKDVDAYRKNQNKNLNTTAPPFMGSLHQAKEDLVQEEKRRSFTQDKTHSTSGEGG